MQRGRRRFGNTCARAAAAALAIALSLAPQAFAADATVPRSGVLVGVATTAATPANATVVTSRLADAEARAGRKRALADIPV